MKHCSKCEKTKPKAEFSKDKKVKEGVRSQCKACDKQYYQENVDNSKQYYQENAERKKQYRQETTEKRAEYDKQYYQENAERKKQYRQENAKKIKQYQQERRKSDPIFKFAGNARALIRKSFKRGKTKGLKKQTKTEQLLGCSIAELRAHLAKQFMPGMSLDNHGEWHIDHRIPLASASTQAEIEALCHYTNLQPLWAEDNLKKSNRML